GRHGLRARRRRGSSGDGDLVEAVRQGALDGDEEIGGGGAFGSKDRGGIFIRLCGERGEGGCVSGEEDAERRALTPGPSPGSPLPFPGRGETSDEQRVLRLFSRPGLCVGKS